MSDDPRVPLRARLADVRARAPLGSEDIWRLLAVEPSRMLRREAAAGLPLAPRLYEVALSDPHWRVREVLLRRLAREAPIEALREGTGAPAREAAARWLDWVWRGSPDETPPAAPTIARPAIWDDDPAVLLRRLRGLGRALRDHLDDCLALLDHDEPRVRTRAIKALVEHADAARLADCLRRWADPRAGHAMASVERIWTALDLDRREAAARQVLADETAPRSAIMRALADAGTHWPLAEDDPLAARTAALRASGSVHASAETGDAMDGIEAASRRANDAMGGVEDHDEGTDDAMGGIDEQGTPSAEWAPIDERRPLWRGGPRVSALGLSGHYGLSARGFAKAHAAGIDLHFWEPGYAHQTRFFRALPAAERAGLTVVAGSFRMEPAELRADAERALRLLGVQRLGLFLLFWVRSPGRLADDVRAELAAMVQRGDVAAFGLSTHQFELGAEAIAADWPVIMLRHSVAHRGAEARALPLAARRDVGVITFSALCYGRLLSPAEAAAPLLYRYSLDTPGVRATLTAPATEAQLAENLTALRRGALTPEERAALRAHGDRVYRDERWFARCVRWR